VKPLQSFPFSAQTAILTLLDHQTGTRRSKSKQL